MWHKNIKIGAFEKEKTGKASDFLNFKQDIQTHHLHLYIIVVSLSVFFEQNKLYPCRPSLSFKIMHTNIVLVSYGCTGHSMIINTILVDLILNGSRVE